MYKYILSNRYLLRRRSSIAAVVSVALCVFVVIVVMSVHNGIVVEFKNKNHEFFSDCVVHSSSLVGFAWYKDFISELEKEDYVRACSSVIDSYGLFTQPGADWNEGVEIMGLGPKRHCKATNFGASLYYHKDNPEDAFKPVYDNRLTGYIIGIDVPRYPIVRNEDGQYLHSPDSPEYRLIVSCFPLTAKGALARAGTDFINSKEFSFSDDSHSRIAKVDGRKIYLPFDQLQKMCGMDGEISRASAIYIKFNNKVSLKSGCQKVSMLWQNFVKKNKDKQNANLFDNVSVEPWYVYRRSSIAPMEKEQTMLTLLFIMLGFITVFIIFVIFYMIISHKSKDIGILRSIGISRSNVVEIFLRFAVMVGLIGAVIGSAAGYAFLLKVNELEDWLFEHFHWQLWDRSVYAIGDIPNQVQLNVLLMIIVSAIAASVLGAVVPAIQASRRRPAEVLQVNQL